MIAEVSEISKNLANESKRYKWGAKQLSMTVCVTALAWKLSSRNANSGVGYRRC